MMNVQDQAAQIVQASLLQAEAQLDAEIAALDNMQETDLKRLRIQRINEMKMRAKQKEEWRALGHGRLDECIDQKAWFEECKNNERVVCHFYRGSNEYCEIVDHHLRILAQKHIEARFIKIDGEKSPFIASRLNVYMMPTILMIKEGFTADRIEGLDELGGTAEFKTTDLENRLALSGVIDPPESAQAMNRAAQKAKHGKQTHNKNNKQGKAVYQSRSLHSRVVENEIMDDEFDDISDFSD